MIKPAPLTHPGLILRDEFFEPLLTQPASVAQKAFYREPICQSGSSLKYPS